MGKYIFVHFSLVLEILRHFSAIKYKKLVKVDFNYFSSKKLMIKEYKII